MGSGSLLGQLAQLGIGIGTNSVLLKFSRTAESQADLLGAQMAAQAGYDPREMARFFQKLEAEGGARGPQFLSDHPNPGNRMKAIEDEIRYMPNQRYTAGTGKLARMKAIVADLPAPKKPAQQSGAAPAPNSGSAGATAASIPDSRPSSSVQQYRGNDFSLSYPANWKQYAAQDGSGVTIAAPSGVQESQNGVAVGYGLVQGYYRPKQASASLKQATAEFVQSLRAADPRMRAGSAAAKQTRAGGKAAMVTTLYSESMFPGQTEVDRLVTVQHPNGILYLVFVAPESEGSYANSAFDRILRSMRFSF
jgi:hypothetical protein